MTEVKVNEDHPDAASGPGTFGVSDAFYDRCDIRGRKFPNRIVTKYVVQIPEDVDHWREHRRGDDYGLTAERKYARSVALRRFVEDYGYSPTSVHREIWMEESRDRGIRASDGYRSSFTVWIDTDPDYDPEIPDTAFEM